MIGVGLWRRRGFELWADDGYVMIVYCYAFVLYALDGYVRCIFLLICGG